MKIERFKLAINGYLKKWWKKNKTQQQIDRDHAALKALPNNPYLQSKVLWNDLYGSLQVKLENSYRIIFILSLVIALAIVGFMIVAGESKVEPYVTVIHGDEVLTLDQSTDRELLALHPKLALFLRRTL